MKKNLIVLAVLFIALHGASVLQSCIFMRCEDAKAISISADSLDVSVFSLPLGTYEGWTFDSPLDRSTLNLILKLKEINYNQFHSQISVGSFLSSSHAFSCPDDYSVFIEYIKDIEIINRFDTLGNLINDDITTDFLVHGGEGDLYVEIENVLANKSSSELILAYKKIARGDSLGLIINVRLSDDRILSDTINIYLK
jgi:hypothetical protein